MGRSPVGPSCLSCKLLGEFRLSGQKNIKLSVFVFCDRKLRYIAFTCKICREIYQNLPEYDSLFFSICNQGKLHTMGARYAECTRKVQYQVISQESLVTCPPNLLPKKALIEIQKFQVKCFDSSTEEHCSLINQFVRDCTVEILGGQLRLLMWI